MVAAGLVDEEDQIDYLNWAFGTSYTDLLSLQTHTLQGVEQ